MIMKYRKKLTIISKHKWNRFLFQRSNNKGHLLHWPTVWLIQRLMDPFLKWIKKKIHHNVVKVI